MYKTFIAMVYYLSGKTFTIKITARNNSEAEQVLESKTCGWNNIVGTYLKYTG